MILSCLNITSIDSSYLHLFVPSTDHGSHGESHTLVVVYHVGQYLGGSCHGDTFLVTQLIHSVEKILEHTSHYAHTLTSHIHTFTLHARTTTPHTQLYTHPHTPALVG